MRVSGVSTRESALTAKDITRLIMPSLSSPCRPLRVNHSSTTLPPRRLSGMVTCHGAPVLQLVGRLCVQVHLLLLLGGGDPQEVLGKLPNELKQLSLLFQRDGLTLQMVSDGLQTTTLSLVAMQTDPGPRLQKVLDEVGPGNTWQNVQLNRRETDNSTFNSLKLRLINDRCRFLSARFGNLETGILKATSTLFDLSNWPEDTAELATFGNAELIEFMEHFQSILAECGDFTSGAADKREWLD
ncbi:hypothetical protein F7725_027005 [Dissostichus mawsoni]|uniref:Uncharacterized protein n=1 Tax=Dissostichus mawsoni TaxID=36200 RepID=A0A7J5X8M3_DISMA|nr:hypothetical protein F7725_027005 [Dissostichus mawsoni]